MDLQVFVGQVSHFVDWLLQLVGGRDFEVSWEAQKLWAGLPVLFLI